MEKKVVYVDYNATTPLESSVISAICNSLTDLWQNPSSNYDCGLRAKAAIEDSRHKVGKMISCNSPADEIIFTSGGTEANNWLFNSLAQEYKTKSMEKDAIGHVITTNVEHDSIIEALNSLATLHPPLLEVTIVPITKDSKSNYYTINPESLFSAVKPNTILISVMLANNETGYIQNIPLIGQMLQQLNVDRLNCNLSKIYLHSDAAQAIGKIDVNVEDLKVDYLTIVGHKFYGPRIGALYYRKGSPLHPLFAGGGQEKGLRPGTENTPCIIGLGEAAHLVTMNLHLYQRHFLNIQSYLESKLEKTFGHLVTVNGKAVEQRLPNTVSVSFNNERLKGYLILKHASRVRASVGAACHSNSERVSPVLIASGIDEKVASCTLRLSVGRETGETDIDIVVDDLHSSVNCILNSI